MKTTLRGETIDLNLIHSFGISFAVFLTIAHTLFCVIDVKHGCISPRTFYHELTKLYDKFPAAKLSKPPVSLHGQLMWI